MLCYWHREYKKNKFYNAVGFIKNWEGTIFLDAYINKKYLKLRSDFNVALLVESKAVKHDVYKRIYELHDQFDLILTHDKEILINFEEKARYVPADTISVGEQYFGMNMELNKLISFNFSKKLICWSWLRHTIAKRYEVYDDQVIYKLGSGPQGIRIVEKGEMLRPYYFSICIENSLYSDYFMKK